MSIFVFIHFLVLVYWIWSCWFSCLSLSCESVTHFKCSPSLFLLSTVSFCIKASTLQNQVKSSNSFTMCDSHFWVDFALLQGMIHYALFSHCQCLQKNNVYEWLCDSHSIFMWYGVQWFHILSCNTLYFYINMTIS